MPEFKSYSTRNFKTDHIKRLKLLKTRLKINSVENVLIKVVETGLLIMENPMKEFKVHKSENALIQQKRIAPFGIIEHKENQNE